MEGNQRLSFFLYLQSHLGLDLLIAVTYNNIALTFVSFPFVHDSNVDNSFVDLFHLGITYDVIFSSC